MPHSVWFVLEIQSQGKLSSEKGLHYLFGKNAEKVLVCESIFTEEIIHLI